MINLIYTPQKSHFKVNYSVNGDILNVKIDGIMELFDFTGFEEGMAEEIIAEVLPINPIVSVEKIDNTVNITVIRFYGEDEKEVFEIGYN